MRGCDQQTCDFIAKVNAKQLRATRYGHQAYVYVKRLHTRDSIEMRGCDQQTCDFIAKVNAKQLRATRYGDIIADKRHVYCECVAEACNGDIVAERSACANKKPTRAMAMLSPSEARVRKGCGRMRWRY